MAGESTNKPLTDILTWPDDKKRERLAQIRVGQMMDGANLADIRMLRPLDLPAVAERRRRDLLEKMKLELTEEYKTDIAKLDRVLLEAMEIEKNPQRRNAAVEMNADLVENLRNFGKAAVEFTQQALPGMMPGGQVLPRLNRPQRQNGGLLPMRPVGNAR